MVLVVAGCDCGSREVEFYKFGPGVDQKRPEFIEQIYECINECVSLAELYDQCEASLHTTAAQ